MASRKGVISVDLVEVLSSVDVQEIFVQEVDSAIRESLRVSANRVALFALELVEDDIADEVEDIIKTLPAASLKRSGFVAEAIFRELMDRLE